MAEPKKRTNRTKRGMRRMHDKVAAPALVYCSNCHEAMKLHNVCPSCGFYKGKSVIQDKESVKIKTEDK